MPHKTRVWFKIYENGPNKSGFSLLTLTAAWTAGGGVLEAAGLECAEAKAEVSEGLRAGAGISTAAVVRHLCTGVTTVGW